MTLLQLKKFRLRKLLHDKIQGQISGENPKNVPALPENAFLVDTLSANEPNGHSQHATVNGRSHCIFHDPG